jgi:DNA-binding transcriptional ArsR family regulator
MSMRPEPEHEREEFLELTSPAQLKALGHPLRLKVLQTLGDSDEAMTNRELAERLEVDPGHLHFHVRMLHRAGLIELAPSKGREKPYRPVASVLRVGAEMRAAGLATELHAMQLREVQRGFDEHAATGAFGTFQVHARVESETIRVLLRELGQKLEEIESDGTPLQLITIAFHPASERGEAD